MTHPLPVAAEAAPSASWTPQVDDEISVLIVDDHRSFGDLLAAALASVPGLRCVGTAVSAADGVHLAVTLRPDVVVMDIEMPGRDGLTATRELLRVYPEVVVAVITAHLNAEWISRAARAGACGFIPKDGSLTEMIDVIRRVRPGQMIVAPSVFARTESAAAFDSPAGFRLTTRELQVLQMCGQGMPAAGISRALGISLHTCRGYIKALYAKLDVSSQLEAVVKAQRLGLIQTTQIDPAARSGY